MQRDPQTVEIGAAVQRQTEQRLGRDVGQGAADSSGLSRTAAVGGKAEVGQLDAFQTVPGHLGDQVRRLHVTMDQPCGVDVPQAAQDLDGEALDHRGGGRARPQYLIRRTPPSVLQDQVGNPADLRRPRDTRRSRTRTMLGWRTRDQASNSAESG